MELVHEKIAPLRKKRIGVCSRNLSSGSYSGYGILDIFRKCFSSSGNCFQVRIIFFFLLVWLFLGVSFLLYFYLLSTLAYQTP